VEQAVADAGYSSGEAMKFCEENNIDAYIPNHGQYKPERKGFVYDKENDRYMCTRGNKAELPFRKIRTDNRGYSTKIYRSDNSKCKKCPYRPECTGKADFKKITDSIDKPYYDRMHRKMQTDYAKKLSRIRSRTVEPVLGTLINFLNMRRVNTRGISLASKHVMMSAISYNLKKYLKFISKKVGTQASAVCIERLTKAKTLFFRFIASFLMKPEFSLQKLQMKN
jgi:radical SAM protein with 4Fe4S-binding SPASM domain